MGCGRDPVFRGICIEILRVLRDSTMGLYGLVWYSVEYTMVGYSMVWSTEVLPLSAATSFLILG